MEGTLGVVQDQVPVQHLRRKSFKIEPAALFFSNLGSQDTWPKTYLFTGLYNLFAPIRSVVCKMKVAAR